MKLVCKEADIVEGKAKGFALNEETQIIVLRWQGSVHAYKNSCPHAGWPLNFSPDQFFNLDKTLLQCSNHMAMFDPKTGLCTSGPCSGDELQRLTVHIENGAIFVNPDINDKFVAD